MATHLSVDFHHNLMPRSFSEVYHNNKYDGFDEANGRRRSNSSRLVESDLRALLDRKSIVRARISITATKDEP